MTATVFCYHCRTYHPKEEVRQVATKAGKRWRCHKSIAATKAGAAEREAFGQRVSELNRATAEYLASKHVVAGPCLQIR